MERKVCLTRNQHQRSEIAVQQKILRFQCKQLTVLLNPTECLEGFSFCWDPLFDLQYSNYNATDFIWWHYEIHHTYWKHARQVTEWQMFKNMSCRPWSTFGSSPKAHSSSTDLKSVKKHQGYWQMVWQMKFHDSSYSGPLTNKIRYAPIHKPNKYYFIFYLLIISIF